MCVCEHSDFSDAQRELKQQQHEQEGEGGNASGMYQVSRGHLIHLLT